MTYPASASWSARSAWPTVLVTMPFMDADRPSIQLGLLKAIGQAQGFSVRTLHANLDFAARVGVDYYRALWKPCGRMVGDWLFSVEAFGNDAPDPGGRLLGAFADELAHLGPTPQGLANTLLTMRQRDVPAYLDALVAGFPWQDMRVVGFSSTFQQNTASVALARRLKERHPHILTLFGGANLDGDMGLELLRTAPCIDLAVIGEADEAFPRLLDALAAGMDVGTVPGLARRVNGAVVATPPAPPLAALDALPDPDYDEYFDRAQDLGLLPRESHRTVWIPFESARGCWWGAKHHCTFCGLNGTTMQFRSKSVPRVLEELQQQTRRYRSFLFESVDNILDMHYLKELFPALAQSGTDYQMFFEVKANLTRAQLKAMAEGGVSHIQPGVESLSSNVLRLMRKGVRAAANVNVLRWAQHYGMHVAWNLLWGFPGETEQDYADQAAVIPHLRHLRPPVSAARIWMERFSPLYVESDTFRLRSRIPERSYRYVYPPVVDLERMAYFFEYELEGALPDEAYAGVRHGVQEWRNAWQADSPPVLTHWSAPGFLQIYDDRQDGHQGTYTFQGTLADIYLACSDRPMTAGAVRDKLGSEVPVEAIREAFEEFGQRGLMFLDEALAVSLSLPATAGR